jgi:hypothetical protein
MQRKVPSSRTDLEPEEESVEDWKKEKKDIEEEDQACDRDRGGGGGGGGGGGARIHEHAYWICRRSSKRRRRRRRRRTASSIITGWHGVTNQSTILRIALCQGSFCSVSSYGSTPYDVYDQ